MAPRHHHVQYGLRRLGALGASDVLRLHRADTNSGPMRKSGSGRDAMNTLARPRPGRTPEQQRQQRHDPRSRATWGSTKTALMSCVAWSRGEALSPDEALSAGGGEVDADLLFCPGTTWIWRTSS